MITSEPEDVLLCQLPGLKAPLLRRLQQQWPTAAAILRAPSSELRAAGVPPALISRLVAAPRQLGTTSAGLRSLERMGIGSVSFLSPDYPTRLRDMDDPPLLLHVQGRWQPPEPSVALIVDAEATVDDAALRSFLDQLQEQGVALVVDADAPGTYAPFADVCVLPFGALLARSRVPEALREVVEAGYATLVSIVPVNGQPTPASEAQALAVRMMLADGVLLTTAEAPTLTLRPATFRWSFAPVDDPAHTYTVIKLDESGLRQITRALGVHRTATATIQQERLW